MDRRSFLAASLAVPLVARPSAANDMHFPGKEWAVVKPEEEDVDSARLGAAVDYLRKHSGKDGVKELLIVRRGRVVWQGENIDKVHGIWSCTKSFTSTVLGLLIDDKKCTLDTKAASIVPELKAHYPDVTLRHFTTMTSGYRAVGDDKPPSGYLHGPSATPFVPTEPLFKPGEKYAYWDSAMNMFGLVLTAIAGEPLEALLKRRIMDPIGAARRTGGGAMRKGPVAVKLKVNSGSGNAGGHVQISARELARFGHLVLNGGKWDGKQLISRSGSSRRPRSRCPPHSRTASRRATSPARAATASTGGSTASSRTASASGRARPTKTFAALGHNNNLLSIVPEWQMVIVRLGLDQADRKIGDGEIGEFLKRIGSAIAG